MSKLFVYGTLRNGEKNHFYLNHSTLIFNQCWVSGSLFDTGNGYPVMLKDEINTVYGELYEVTSEQLNEIDRLEGFVEDDPGNLYDRESVTVTNDKGHDFEAFTYFGGESLIDSTDKIATGDWNVHMYLTQQDLHYFAYGSCMDNERFKLQGVNHHFESVVGNGSLNGFVLKFSRNSNDGGKADIVEDSSETVEGKLYEVPLDAITYLYKREGVYANAYRPIIVTINARDKEIRAITFIGTEKEAETPPTVKYASEIIRGSKGFLSDAYVDKLQKKIDLLLKN
ncbi:gamma-glutamylcyclotransferase [Virgibacillus sp. DJP39]|uniref:gamma-glutamylcyclotransferase n=1 Tax=Virgibacillus sp. DJP39 TaxID=3409790 RepID=UPI003BB6ACD9